VEGIVCGRASVEDPKEGRAHRVLAFDLGPHLLCRRIHNTRRESPRSTRADSTTSTATDRSSALGAQKQKQFEQRKHLKQFKHWHHRFIQEFNPNRLH
jgi:hypothetical protein